MKRMMVIAGLCLLSFGSKSQVVVDGTNINDLDIKYIEMVGRAKVLSLTKIKIFIDYGQEFSFKQQTVKTADGKNAGFNSIVDALNFLDANGWEYVSNYIIDNQGQLTYKYLLKKKS